VDGRGTGVDTVVLAETVDAESLEAMRGRVLEVGQRQGLTGLELMKFVLAVHELMINAVRHGGGSAHVVLWTDPGGMRCSVVDHGRGIPRQYVDDQRGRPVAEVPRWGLRLVRSICGDVRVDTGDDGTRIEFGYCTGGSAAERADT
jgi:anti-sigma regulatory factor (Ser/Thr protein kinase)